MPPVAARWHNREEGTYTIAVLHVPPCKKGTSHRRVYIESEDVFHDEPSADDAWRGVENEHAVGVVPLQGADAVTAMNTEIVEGKFGCLWRRNPQRCGPAADGISSGDASRSGVASSVDDGGEMELDEPSHEALSDRSSVAPSLPPFYEDASMSPVADPPNAWCPVQAMATPLAALQDFDMDLYPPLPDVPVPNPIDDALLELPDWDARSGVPPFDLVNGQPVRRR